MLYYIDTLNHDKDDVKNNVNSVDGDISMDGNSGCICPVNDL